MEMFCFVFLNPKENAMKFAFVRVLFTAQDRDQCHTICVVTRLGKAHTTYKRAKMLLTEVGKGFNLYELPPLHSVYY